MRAEAEEEEEEGLDEKMLHLTAKLERQFAESAKLEAMIRENLRGWSYGIEELLKSKRSDILRIATHPGALNVRVFGSVARGEATADSEVDFLV